MSTCSGDDCTDPSHKIDGTLTINGIEEVKAVEEKKESKKLDEHEEAAVFFHFAKQEFRKLGYNLANRKKRALVRVVEAVLFEPLEEVKLEGKEEQALFRICQQIMFNKAKIMQYAVQRAEAKKGEQNESEKK